MSMKKTDYELIAGVLFYTFPEGTPLQSGKRKQWEWMTHSIAETLEKNNKKFDRIKFLTLCGVEQ